MGKHIKLFLTKAIDHGVPWRIPTAEDQGLTVLDASHLSRKTYDRLFKDTKIMASSCCDIGKTFDKQPDGVVMLTLNKLLDQHPVFDLYVNKWLTVHMIRTHVDNQHRALKDLDTSPESREEEFEEALEGWRKAVKENGGDELPSHKPIPPSVFGFKPDPTAGSSRPVSTTSTHASKKSKKSDSKATKDDNEERKRKKAERKEAKEAKKAEKERKKAERKAATARNGNDRVMDVGSEDEQAMPDDEQMVDRAQEDESNQQDQEAERRKEKELEEERKRKELEETKKKEREQEEERQKQKELEERKKQASQTNKLPNSRVESPESNSDSSSSSASVTSSSSSSLASPKPKGRKNPPRSTKQAPSLKQAEAVPSNSSKKRPAEDKQTNEKKKKRKK